MATVVVHMKNMTKCFYDSLDDNSIQYSISVDDGTRNTLISPSITQQSLFAIWVEIFVKSIYSVIYFYPISITYAYIISVKNLNWVWIYICAIRNRVYSNYPFSLVTVQFANTVELDVWQQPTNLEIHFALRPYIIHPVNNVYRLKVVVASCVWYRDPSYILIA